MVDVAIVGIGMHAFGRHEGVTGMEQGAIAVRRAVANAGVEWKDMQFAFGGSRAAGDPDRMVSMLGLTGLQFINVTNGCATGGSALFSAYNTIQSGIYDLGIAIGFDKHPRGAFSPTGPEISGRNWYGGSGMAMTTQFFAMKINQYMQNHNITNDSLARVAAKAFRNGSKNPMAWRRKALTEDEILQSPMLSYPLTQYMFCNPGEGGVALVLCRADMAHKYTKTPVFLNAAVIRSRRFGSFEVTAPSLALEQGDGPTMDASKAAFEMAGVGPEDIDVAQLQDTETGAEIMHMAENGFCEHGEQEAMLANGDTEIGGRFPVNTDGGCLANGEPIGASGLRQVYENVLQLRGDAGERQVPDDPKVAYTHVYGSPGISGVTILSK
ncbi:MAG: thiolase family protein [Gammaproteobacteria bacterium]|jgi:acetyl-CoA acetyltransferase|nr:thiolase family protein [Gammaproteobacteria bacterium]MBT3868039.1 thiolase family protein [Gammaproteobacteria bacterium]MBT4381746.1 thiolase family protein [Gammaproteobacteria bacterium]MBT4614821.1 thiolase family protein [Gammaproteobacteria bacterium]MBT5198402.1 thiolase family protein [Gammaproteobacteria bacterium]